MPDQTTTNVEAFFTPGPGERLRAARLSMGYDLAKIATELHLTTPVVEALEADDFAGIGARVFVRGYLRNYARIVGMPVDSILRQFDEKWPDEGGGTTMLKQSPTLPADGGPSRGWMGAVSWLVLIALVVFFIMWWRGYLDQIVPGDLGTSASTESERVSGGEAVDTSNAELLGQDDPILADGSLRLPAPPSDLPADNSEDATSISAPSGVTDEAPVPLVATPAPSSGSGSLALPTRAPSAQNVTEELIASSASAGDAATVLDGGAPVVDGTLQIVMTFTDRCWVDVRDSERKFKLFGQMSKGTRRVLGGTPPYKMVIGDAKAVQITVNGEPFDLKPFAKGNVARFTLNP